MDTKPSWVPDWIWEAFENERRRFRPLRKAGGNHDPKQYLVIVESVLRDRDCAIVWKAIDARQHLITERDPDETHPVSWMENTLYVLGETARALPKNGRTPWAQRRALYEEIASHAIALRQALDALRNDDYEFPLPIEHALEAEVAAIVEQGRPLMLETVDKEDADQFAYWTWMGAMVALYRTDKWLRAMADVATDAQKMKPRISQVASKNALRLWFIRGVTGLFRDEFGQPLRACVAALANSIYRSDLTTQDIAKLAP